MRALCSSPCFDKHTGNRPEYAAAWDKNTLFLLVRRPRARSSARKSSSKPVLQVWYFRSILDCNGTVAYRDGDAVKNAAFHFNYFTEKELVPILI